MTKLSPSAQKIKRAFIRARRAFAALREDLDPGSEVSDDLDYIFETVDRTIGMLDFDVGLFAKYAVFSARLACGPVPSQLIRRGLISDFKKSLPMLKQKMKLALTSQLITFRNAVGALEQQYGGKEDPKKFYAFVLLDVEQPFSGLFRYCLAEKLKLPAVSKVFEDTAREEFLLSPITYLETWKSYIPFAFLEEARSEVGR